MSKYVKVCLRVVCDLSDHMQGTYSSDITLQVGFPLRPFTDLSCIHGYHPTLYTVEPPKKVATY